MTEPLTLQDTSSIYITTQGTTLSIRNKRLEVSLNGELIGQALLHSVSRICIFGAAHLSFPLIDHCLRNGITIHYFSTHGIHKGMLYGKEIMSYKILERQLLTSEEDALPLIKSILQAQISSRINILRKKSFPTDQLVATLPKIGRAQTMDSLRGIEGQAAAFYWGSFASMLSTPSLFNGRTRRPPKDIANSLLSFGYVLLASEIEPHVRYYGLNPYRGFLHQFRHGRKSLVLDLLEQFRPVIEHFTISLLNRKQLTKKHFRKEGVGHYLTDEGKRKYLASYEQLMRKKHKNEKGEMTLRNIIQLQVQKLTSWLMSRTDYLPLVMS